jgi:hypothetical protein
MMPVPIRVNHAVFDEQTNFIVANIVFLENNVKRRFCWPADDLVQVFGIKGEVLPHHWHKFCQDIKGKEMKMVCEMVGDPEAPAATYEQMSKTHADLIGRYFSEDE